MTDFDSKNRREYRTRNFSTLVYQESAPDHWVEILKNMMVPAFISPLHDRDTNPGGEQKKPHWHVIVMFDSVKNKKQAEEVFSKINGVGLEPIRSLRGYVRYLCHLDNPEKAQYNPAEVLCFCGADYYDAISLVTDRYKVIADIEQFCDDFDFVSLYALAKFCRENRPDWHRVILDNTIYIKEFLKSRHWTRSNFQQN